MGYKLRLRRSYSYVLDMPIKLKAGQHPKYRMVHATNHPSGCVLMADNIAKRTDRLVIEIQNGGQLSLMQQTAENEFIDDAVLETLVKTEIDKLMTFTPLTMFLADFYNAHGVTCGTPRLSSGKSGSVLKTLEKSGYITVQRNPAVSEKTGKKTTFWSENAKQKISIRRS